MRKSAKRIGLTEIYLKGYPYKRNYPFKPNTIPQPYIKKEDISLHEYACDFHLFRNVVEGYLDYVIESMIEGNAWRLNFGLGEIRIKKFKVKFIKDKTLLPGTVEPKNIYRRALMPDDYYLAARWHRGTMRVKLKYNWMVTLVRPHFVECYNRIKKDNTHIYKYQDE